MTLSLDDVADFVWGFDHEFLLKVEKDGETRYYVWSDPDYNGDNTIRPYTGNPMDFTSPGFSGRCKGRHFIRRYCGDEVKILEA